MNTLFEQYDDDRQEADNRPACFLEASTEWYTPVQYINAARKVMGSIDLDPASCAFANQTVRATICYDKNTNGLGKTWVGNIWLNPPYGRTEGNQKANASSWIHHLIEQYELGNTKQAILLVNAWTSRRWFEPLWAYPLCFHSGSLSFYNNQGIGSRNPVSNVFVYLGPNEQAFIEHFSKFGRIAKAIDKPKPKITPLCLWEVSA